MPRASKNQRSRRDASRPIKPTQDEISREAFRIYQARHGAPGDPVADWFEAERIVMARAVSKAPRAAEAQAEALEGGSGGRRARRPIKRKR
jgi:hypothetical protein